MASPRCWIDHYNENYSPMYKTEWTFLDLEGKVKTITPISASNVRYTRKKKKFVGILRTMTSKLVDFWIIYLD